MKVNNLILQFTTKIVFFIILFFAVHKWTLPGIILGLFVGFCDFIKFIIETLKEK